MKKVCRKLIDFLPIYKPGQFSFNISNVKWPTDWNIGKTMCYMVVVDKLTGIKVASLSFSLVTLFACGNIAFIDEVRLALWKFFEKHGVGLISKKDKKGNTSRLTFYCMRRYQYYVDEYLRGNDIMGRVLAKIVKKFSK